MATSLGKVNVQIGADSSGLTAGFDTAKNAVAGMGSSLKSGLGGIAGVAASALGSLSGIGSTVAGFLKSGFGLFLGGAASLGEALEKAFTNPIRFINDAVIGGLGNLVSQIPVLGPLLALP